MHQIRNSLKYVGSKNQKEFLSDLKLVYSAVGKEATETQLDSLETKWGEQYPSVIKSWRDNWERLTEYFQYTPMIRKLIYFYCPPKKTPESVSRYNKFPFYGLWQTELHIRHEHFFVWKYG